MTKKKMWWTTGLYAFCALIWTMNFFLSWHKEGMINVSTGLFGLSAALFTLSAVLGLIRIIRLQRENAETGEEK